MSTTTRTPSPDLRAFAIGLALTGHVIVLVARGMRVLAPADAVIGALAGCGKRPVERSTAIEHPDSVFVDARR